MYSTKLHVFLSTFRNRKKVTHKKKEQKQYYILITSNFTIIKRSGLADILNQNII